MQKKVATAELTIEREGRGTKDGDQYGVRNLEKRGIRQKSMRKEKKGN